MKVMMMRKADSETEKGIPLSDTVLKAVAEFSEKLIEAGVYVEGAALKPSSAGLRIVVKAGQPQVIDGPFAETKELLAGYLIVDVASMDEAIEWAKNWPCSDAEGNVTVELRPYYED